MVEVVSRETAESSAVLTNTGRMMTVHGLTASTVATGVDNDLSQYMQANDKIVSSGCDTSE